MTGKPDNETWIGDARALLDASAQELDAATVARLARARSAALSHARAPRWSHWRSWWMPLSGLAAACALVAALGLRQPHRADPVGAAPPIRTGVDVEAAPPMRTGVDVEAAASDETIDLTQDLEFYAWLEAREDSDG